jgi:hypothetical protein
MPRLSRFELLKRNRDVIANSFYNLSSTNILSFPKISTFIEESKSEWSIPNKTSVNEVLNFLTEEDILKEISIKLPRRTTVRYVWGSPSPYQLALSLNAHSYLTHYSALYLYGLTNNVTKTIYTNVEQAKKFYYEDDDVDEESKMKQKDIDLAFSRPMRHTNQIAHFELDGTKYQVYMLNGKYHNRLGVTKNKFDNLELPITSVERTLIDIVVRPNYSGGVEEVLEAFIEAKGSFSVNKLVATLKKMKYKYPYHQLIGFYLEKAGYKPDLLNLVKQIDIKYDFYLTYQMKDKAYSDTWKVYYPKGFAE